MPIFAKHIVQNPYLSVDDVIFQPAILCIFRHRTETRITFLEFSDQTGSETKIRIK